MSDNKITIGHVSFADDAPGRRHLRAREMVDKALKREPCPTCHRDCACGPKCSFCDKQRSEVAQLVSGPHVFICNECVDRCKALVMEQHVKDMLGRAGKP